MCSSAELPCVFCRECTLNNGNSLWQMAVACRQQFHLHTDCPIILNEIRRTCPLYSHTRHTHTHAGGTTVEGVLCFFPSWHPPPGTARSSGRPAMRRPGTKSKCSVLTWSGSGPTSICSFLHVFIIGVLWGEPGYTGRTCKLHTERPGNKPWHVARCGTWTHDLLAVRQQCYALCRLSIYIKHQMNLTSPQNQSHLFPWVGVKLNCLFSFSLDLWRVGEGGICGQARRWGHPYSQWV